MRKRLRQAAIASAGSLAILPLGSPLEAVSYAIAMDRIHAILIDYWPHLVFAISIVAGTGAAVHAAMTKQDVRAAIGWVGVAMFSPLLGPLFYFVAGINRIRKTRVSQLRDEAMVGDAQLGRDGAGGRGADLGRAVRVAQGAGRPRQPVPAAGRQPGAAAGRRRRNLSGHAASHPGCTPHRGNAKLYLRQRCDRTRDGAGLDRGACARRRGAGADRRHRLEVFPPAHRAHAGARRGAGGALHDESAGRAAHALRQSAQPPQGAGRRWGAWVSPAG